MTLKTSHLKKQDNQIHSCMDAWDYDSGNTIKIGG
jgi:hypothetical protein